MSAAVWMKFGREMLNHVENSKYYCKNITKDSQHSDILAMCCKVILSFVMFAVLDLRVGGCRR